MVIISTGLLISLIVDFGRMKKGKLQQGFRQYFNWMLREEEKKGSLTGATWVLIAAFTVIALFPKPIAILALLFMSFGDSVAAILGIAIGRIKLFGDKTLEGSLGCLITCLVVGMFFPQIDILVRISGAAAATLFEALALPVNDNFTIPFGSALIMILIAGIV